MASQNGNQATALTALNKIQQAPYKYDFYQSLRLIECIYRDKQRLGYAAKPSDDAIRLGQLPTMQFAPSTLAAFQTNKNNAAALKVFFLGVFGPNGPLPLHLTEYARDRLYKANDPTLVEFVDLFHHRLLSLFYRAWADKEPAVQLDRPAHDRFKYYIGSLGGMAEQSQRQRDEISDHAKLHFAAHLGCQTKHVGGLQAILRSYFQLPVKIEEFIGEWLTIPQDGLCYLNPNKQTGQLGISTTIGARSWQCMHKFRIVAGPLNLQQFESFLPNGKKITALCSFIKNYTGFEFAWDINLVLKKDEVPTVQLGNFGQLGWNSWLSAQTRSRDADDLFVNMENRT